MVVGALQSICATVVDDNILIRGLQYAPGNSCNVVVPNPPHLHSQDRRLLTDGEWTVGAVAWVVAWSAYSLQAPVPGCSVNIRLGNGCLSCPVLPVIQLIVNILIGHIIPRFLYVPYNRKAGHLATVA